MAKRGSTCLSRRPFHFVEQLIYYSHSPTKTVPCQNLVAAGNLNSRRIKTAKASGWHVKVSDSFDLLEALTRGEGPLKSSTAVGTSMQASLPSGGTDEADQ
jgi:hypothetical protein